MPPFSSACLLMHQLYCSAATPGCAQNVESSNTCYHLWASYKSKHLMPFKDHHWGSQSPRRSSGSLFGLVLTFWMRLSILGPILSKLSLKHLTFGHSTFLCTILQPENRCTRRNKYSHYTQGSAGTHCHSSDGAQGSWQVMFGTLSRSRIRRGWGTSKPCHWNPKMSIYYMYGIDWFEYIKLGDIGLVCLQTLLVCITLLLAIISSSLQV